MPSSTRSNKDKHLLFSEDPAHLERMIRKDQRSTSLDAASFTSTDSRTQPSTDLHRSTLINTTPRTSNDHQSRNMVAIVILRQDKNRNLYDQDGHLLTILSKAPTILSKAPTIAFGDPLSFGGDPLDHPLRPRPSPFHPLRPRPSRSLRLISISSIDLYRFSSRHLPGAETVLKPSKIHHAQTGSAPGTAGSETETPQTKPNPSRKEKEKTTEMNREAEKEKETQWGPPATASKGHGSRRRRAAANLSFSASTRFRILKVCERERDLLKETVRKMLDHERSTHVDQLELIDDLQKLGVSYHFEQEIDNMLTFTYHKLDKSNFMEYDLHADALKFRLLRQHGFNVSEGKSSLINVVIFKRRK
ncbi:hypothetical protein F2Q70_00009029 [Brassica cretica]|uniref:Terpene synthase N-terminal domain-containing protein n=1 Tax=Brassica cretica TaxID=69181 RepID=A0A8S9MBU0_BRACR|nr:hypothetical protein F2Q70_00009029 [Brassica cretica]